MPAPSYRLTQTIPACPDAAPSEVDGTKLDRGNVLVNEDCCRRYAPRLTVNRGNVPHTLYLEEDVPTCSQTAAGEKIYSSDAYQLCVGASGKTWIVSFPRDSVPCEFGAAPTLWQEAVMDFTLAGGAFPGNVQVGPFSVTSDANFESGAAQLLDALYALGFSSSQVSVTPAAATRRMTITFANATAPTSLTPTSGQNFADNLSADENQQCPLAYSGPTSGRVRVDAYLRAAWTSCAKGGLVVEERNLIGDDVLAKYANDHHSMKHGIRTLVVRRERLAECDHPCSEHVSAATVRGLHGVGLCVQPVLAQSVCLGGLLDLDMIATFGSDGTGLGEPVNGFIAHNQQSTANWTGWSEPPAAFTGSISVDIVGEVHIYIGAGAVILPARLQMTVTGGTWQPVGLFRACGSRLNAVTGKYESLLNPVQRTQFGLGGEGIGGGSGESGPFWLHNYLRVYWTLTEGTYTIRDPSGSPLPDGYYPGVGTFGTVNPPGVTLNGRYSWEADALPSHCGGLEWLKTDESLLFSLSSSSSHAYFFSDPTALVNTWTPGTYTNSNFLPSSAITSPGTGLSYEAS